MKTVLLIICVIWIFLHYRTNHIYKSKYMGYSTTDIPFMLGTIVSAVSNGFAWYYIFKIMEIIG